VVRLCPPAASEPLLAALELIPNILRGIYPDTGEFPVELLSKAGTIADLEPPEAQGAEGDEDELFMSLLGDWLRFYGPVQHSFICATLGCAPERVRGGLEDLAESEKTIIGRLVGDSDQEFICDSTLRAPLRVARAEARPALRLSTSNGSLFPGSTSGNHSSDNRRGRAVSENRATPLHPGEAELWESEIFPARLKSTRPSGLTR
jgi:ATP-dependent Lhr-like helicase